MIAPEARVNPLLAEIKRIGAELRPAVPGLYLVTAVAIVARYLHGLIPWPDDGARDQRSLHSRPPRVPRPQRHPVLPALRTGHPVLRCSASSGLGIILLGVRLSFQDVVNTGVAASLLILVCVAFALTLAYVLGRFLRIPARFAALIGVGTAICGNSAIIATAPVIEAKDEDVSYAVATITFFGTLAVLLYPTIGYFTGMTDRVFGMWAGTAILDTSQVVAAGAAFSDAARDIATVVKLVRNTLMVPLILLIGVVYTRAQKKRDAAVKVSVSKIMPWFVVGFLGMTLLRTLGNAYGVLPVNVSSAWEPGYRCEGPARLGRSCKVCYPDGVVGDWAKHRRGKHPANWCEAVGAGFCGRRCVGRIQPDLDPSVRVR